MLLIISNSYCSNIKSSSPHQQAWTLCGHWPVHQGTAHQRRETSQTPLEVDAAPARLFYACRGAGTYRSEWEQEQMQASHLLYFSLSDIFLGTTQMACGFHFLYYPQNNNSHTFLKGLTSSAMLQWHGTDSWFSSCIVFICWVIKKFLHFAQQYVIKYNDIALLQVKTGFN